MTEVTDFTDVAVGVAPLFPGILGGDFARLDACVRRVHGGGSGRWRGRVSIERGASFMAKVMGLFASLPRAIADTPIEVDIEASTHSMRVPEPLERIIVFDGICHVCSGWVRFLQRRRIDPPFRAIAMQSAEGKALLAEFGIDPDDPSTFLVLDAGRRFTESDAAIHVVATVGGVWRLCVAARIVPKRWRDALYRLLARNRYRWFGRRATCYLPDP